MNFEEYRPLAARTANLDNPQIVQILYAPNSLTGEWAEYFADRSVDEAGDVCWSLAEICRVWDFVDVEPTRNDTLNPIRAIGVIAEASKKWACHGREREEFAADVEQAVRYLLWILSKWHKLPAVYEFNIAKLTERYPGGFRKAGEEGSSIRLADDGLSFRDEDGTVVALIEPGLQGRDHALNYLPIVWEDDGAGGRWEPILNVPASPITAEMARGIIRAHFDDIECIDRGEQ